MILSAYILKHCEEFIVKNKFDIISFAISFFSDININNYL